MSLPSSDGGLSRLDLAKMSIEHLMKAFKKRHETWISSHDPSMNSLISHTARDKFLLLSTSQQYKDTASCAANGRLLVGFSDENETVVDKFHDELKNLKAASLKSGQEDNFIAEFPEEAGGAKGLNIALSSGVQLMSKYRFLSPLTENFGRGRYLSNTSILNNGGVAQTAIQSAVLVLVTDGACLRSTPRQGGGSLSLQFGSQPLREFYREPFRWDMRIFCIGVGAKEGIQPSQFLHPQLRALCVETGGSYCIAVKSRDLSAIADNVLKRICPPLPKRLPLEEPLYSSLGSNLFSTISRVKSQQPLSFVEGGPICSFQCIESDPTGKPSPRFRAQMLYCGSEATVSSDGALGRPIWFIPEDFFPSKKLDSLPPRHAHPRLMYSTYPSSHGSKTFDPVTIIKQLHRLDQLVTTNRKLAGKPVHLLHRDVYVCEWSTPESGKASTVQLGSIDQEFYPVFIPGGGRELSDDTSFLNIGILHAQEKTSTLSSFANESAIATLTLLPPEIHILLPLLLRACDAEHKVLKRNENDITTGESSKLKVPMEESWRNEFRAYLFRVPAYYQFALKRTLRSVLPSSYHPLLATEPLESLPLLCFSKICLQKIRNAEQLARENIERLDRLEASLRNRTRSIDHTDRPVLRYGQYHPPTPVENYLASLRYLPEPKLKDAEERDENDGAGGELSVLDALGELPARALMAFYESRRRWLFGGQSLASHGLNVEGVYNGGNNYQVYSGRDTATNTCLLALGECGVSMMNKTATARMGDYRERLLFSNPPVVGYGSNDCSGVAATTAPDGSPRWSVDDGALPLTFFDPITGEFSDSIQNRVSSRLIVNFGNPFKESRGDSLVPEKFLRQSPSRRRLSESTSASPGSPPHDSFDSVEEDEALFALSPSRLSPKRKSSEFDGDGIAPVGKKGKLGSSEIGTPEIPKKPLPPPPPPQTMLSKHPPARPLPPAKAKVPVPRKPPPPKPSTPLSVETPSAPTILIETSAIATESAASLLDDMHLQNGDEKPKVDLPVGWMSVWSKSQKRWYFFNTKTNQSVWQWPPPV